MCRRLQHPVSTPSGDSSLYELVVLPFAEYSLGYPQRLTGLHERLHAAPSADAPRFLIVDATRVTRLGEGALLDLLHSAAGQLLGQERRLVLACHLNVLVEDVHLGQLCHVAATREAAVAWCRKRR